MDSLRVNFVTFDSLGKAPASIDSGFALRFYQGDLLDSIWYTNTRWDQLRTGYYEIAYEAPKHYDSLGIYSVFVKVWKYSGTWIGGLALNYQVTKDKGLDVLYDLGAYLGTCDGCVRILYPIDAMPKDSGFVIDTSKAPDDTLMKIIFLHGGNTRVMDTTLTDQRWK